jgi:hypothetical protein
MRIAAKRLRYVLEMTGFCIGAPAETARRRARELQDVLGDLHDCDVMLPRVEQQLTEMRHEDARALRARAGAATDLDPALVTRAPHRTSFRGLEVLAVYLEARRELLFDRFCELWAEQERRGIWKRLERAARDRLEAARKLRQAEREAARAREQLEAAEAVEREARDRARRAAPTRGPAEAARDATKDPAPDATRDEAPDATPRSPRPQIPDPA